VKVMARGALALVATVAMSVGAAGAAHGVRVPRRVPGLPRIHIHVPTGASTHGGGNAGNCGNGASGSSGRHGANGTSNAGGHGGAKGGKGGPGGHGAKGGKGDHC
jgi:hypothetical protein